MRRGSFVVLLVVGALLIPAAVFAAHSFNDVPDSHTHHTGIGWMKDNNITAGCNPPTNTNFCPNDNVTRGQMATFMKRLAENNVVDAATLDGLDSSGLQTVVSGASQDFNSAPSPTFNAFLKLLDLGVEAPVAGTTNIGGTASVFLTGSPSRYVVWVQLDNATCTNFSDEIPGGRAWATVGETPAELMYSTASFTTASALSAGSHTLTLCAQSLEGATITLIDASLTSVFSANGSVLAPLGEVTGRGEVPGE